MFPMSMGNEDHSKNRRTQKEGEGQLCSSGQFFFVCFVYSKDWNW